MPAPVVLRRFRTRLSAAFVLVAGATAGLLALGSFLAIREYRYRTFSDHADQTVRLGLLSVPDELTLRTFEALLHEYRDRAGVETVAQAEGLELSSSPELGLDDVPEGLQTLAPGRLRRADVEVDGRRFLVIGGVPAEGQARLYFFFDRAEVIASVRQTRDVLVVGWLAQWRWPPSLAE